MVTPSFIFASLVGPCHLMFIFTTIKIHVETIAVPALPFDTCLYTFRPLSSTPFSEVFASEYQETHDQALNQGSTTQRPSQPTRQQSNIATTKQHNLLQQNFNEATKQRSKEVNYKVVATTEDAVEHECFCVGNPENLSEGLCCLCVEPRALERPSA